MAEVVVAELGVEGGGATILGHRTDDRWVFWHQGSSLALDANDDEAWRAWESEQAGDLAAVVPPLWPLMYPMKIHPEFVGWFRDQYEAARAALRDDMREYQARHPHHHWQHVFGNDPIS